MSEQTTPATQLADVGVIGMAVMGSSLARNMAHKGYATAIYNRTFEVIPMLLVAVFWYLLVTSILNIAQSAIERHYNRGDRGVPAATAGKGEA